MTLTNCSFFKNEAFNVGVIEVGNETLITNCIVWGNISNFDIYINGDPTINNSIIEGGWTGAGSNNLDQDPLFLDPINNDLRLSDNSPAIEAGDNTADLDGSGSETETISDVAFDLAGNPRIFDFNKSGTAIVDMGAYEANIVEVPTLSEWGLLILALLLMTIGTLYLIQPTAKPSK